MSWAWVRHRCWSALGAAVMLALVASCSAADDTLTAPLESMTSITSAPAPTSDSTADAVTTPDPAEDSTTAATSPTTTTSSLAMTSLRTALPYPGGMTGLDMLNHRGLLTADGQLRFHDGARAADDDDSHLASATACSYVFGLPGQVAGTAVLPASLALTETSGYSRSPDRTILACIYQAPSDQGESIPLLALQITDGPPLDPEAPGAPVIVSEKGFQASLSYSPAYDGTRITEADAGEWLGQALSLIATT